MVEQLTIIGGGAIGEALVAGAIKSGRYDPRQIVISEPVVSRREFLQERYQVKGVSDNLAAITHATTVVMAVKPQVYADAIRPLARHLAVEQLLISVAAGIATAEIEAFLSARVPVVRAMPNTPCLVGKGATVLTRGSYAAAEHVTEAEKLFSALGITVELPEENLNAITALSGSGPAYIYLLLEALMEAGVRVGLPRELSKQLMLQTMVGSVQLITETKKHPAELKEMVTSPGGTTAAALEYLEGQGIRGTIITAVVKAWERAEELSL